MNKVLKVAKYQLHDFKTSLIIYYLIIIAIGLVWIVSSYNNLVSGESNFTGASIIFIFIMGLNSFKDGFKFMQANNVSRKVFYLGNLSAIICLALAMAVIDAILTKILAYIAPYQGIFEQIYINKSMFGDIIWSFGLLTLIISFGWLITMLYYRSSTMLKIFISISPVFLMVLVTYINRLTNGIFVERIVYFFETALGFTNNLNPYIAVLSFIVGIVIVSLLSYLLIKRAPIKD